MIDLSQSQNKDSMGSISSKSSVPTQMIAQWRNRQKCSCHQNNYYVIKVSRISVPMAGELLVELGHQATLGITKVLSRFQQYSHDVVQLRVRCMNCQIIMNETMEFSRDGKERRWGLYGKIKETIKAKVSKKTFYPYRLVQESYRKMNSGGYKLFRYNCKDWAKQLYNDLQSITY